VRLCIHRDPVTVAHSHYTRVRVCGTVFDCVTQCVTV
jgi:hypothetical protein